MPIFSSPRLCLSAVYKNCLYLDVLWCGTYLKPNVSKRKLKLLPRTWYSSLVLRSGSNTGARQKLRGHHWLFLPHQQWLSCLHSPRSSHLLSPRSLPPKPKSCNSCQNYYLACWLPDILSECTFLYILFQSKHKWWRFCLKCSNDYLFLLWMVQDLS